MKSNLRPAIVASAILLVLCGLAYPLAGTGISQLLFPHQANGSLNRYGSTLIGQSWPVGESGPQWFQGRPDGSVLTTGPGGVIVSGTEQLGPRSKQLVEAVAKRAATLKREGIVPANDLVTYSGSLVDPDINPAAAYDQVNAIARARGLPPAALRRLVTSHIEEPQFGFLGAAYVNVLDLNVALLHVRRSAGPPSSN